MDKKVVKEIEDKLFNNIKGPYPEMIERNKFLNTYLHNKETTFEKQLKDYEEEANNLF